VANWAKAIEDEARRVGVDPESISQRYIQRETIASTAPPEAN